MTTTVVTGFIMGILLFASCNSAVVQHHNETDNNDETNSELHPDVSAINDDENMAQYDVDKENAELPLVEDFDTVSSAAVLGAEKKSRSKRWTSTRTSGCCNGRWYSTVVMSESGCRKTCSGTLSWREGADAGKGNYEEVYYHHGMRRRGCMDFRYVCSDCGGEKYCPDFVEYA